MKEKIGQGKLFLEFDVEGVMELCMEYNGSSVLSRDGAVQFLDVASNRLPFFQVQVAGRNRQTTNCKSLLASESITAEFVRQIHTRTHNADVFEIETKNDTVKVVSTFTFLDGTNTFSVKNTVTNISGRRITLEEVNSLSFSGMGGFVPSLTRNKSLFLHIPHNSWHTEVQWQRLSLAELGLYSGNGRANMKSIKIANTGSLSTKEYLPMGVLENSLNNTFILWQIEHNGSWCYELGESDGMVYLSMGGPSLSQNMWSVNLEHGQSFEGVTSSVTVGDSLEEVFGNITKYRRGIRRPNLDNINLPVIFNSYMHAFWDYPQEEQLVPLIDAVASVGCDYFCIDAGWHDEESWYTKIGEWKQSESRFPSGVKKTLDYIKSKGMRAGLWVEIENVGTESKNLHELPSECYFRHAGEPIIKTNRMMLDFSHPLVIERANRVIDSIVALGADYIKIDYNLDTGAGTDCSDGDFGHGLFKHNRAYIKWIKSVYQRYPHLVIENCASGGCRMDYALLKLHSIQSTSDQIDYKKYPYISANAITALTPEQSAVWSYPLAGDANAETLSEETVVMNMVNSLLGRIHLASRIDLLNKKHLKLIKEGINCYRKMTEFKVEALPFFPCGLARFGDKHVVSGLKNGNKAMLAVWNLGGESRLSVPLGFTAKSVSIMYPTSLNGVSCSLNGKELNVEFKEEFQARLILIEG